MAVSALSDGSKATPGRLLKVNHAGEFGAVNIYRAQILVAHLTARETLPQLRAFLAHERGHLQTFEKELLRRHIPRCRSYWFCGAGGWTLGVLTAFSGKAGIMACTAAVETVVTRHLVDQLQFVKQAGDGEAYAAIASIVEEEHEHRRHGVEQGRSSLLYKPISAVVSASTSLVIWLGMAL